MKRGITALALEPTDLITSIEVAEEVGYDAIELRTSMIAAFLAQGHSTEELLARFESVSVRPNLIGAITDIDMPEGPERDELVAFFSSMCEVTRAIGCPGIQVVSGTAFSRSPWPTIRKETAKGLREIADIAAEYKLNVAYEPLAWMPVKTLAQVLEVVDEAGCSNVGLLVDTFQIFAGGDDLETIRKLDPKMIPTVHLGDTAPRQRDVWSDYDRYTMPGDGIVPLRDIMKAILETGYDDVVTDEIWSARYTYWSRLRIAEALKAKGDTVLASFIEGPGS